MTMNTDGVVERLDIFKNQFICMSIIENFETINPLPFQKGMERFYASQKSIEYVIKSWTFIEIYDKVRQESPGLFIMSMIIS